MIQIAQVIGKGNTELSAFDNALFNAGIENRNLIYLSSVIPEGEQAMNTPLGNKVTLQGKWGDKLYVVMANKVASVGETASAGIAYAYEKDSETPRGLFVEHELKGENSKDQVETLLRTSLDDLFTTRGLDKTDTSVTIKSVKNNGEAPYLCPMVVAVFEEEGWNSFGV